MRACTPPEHRQQLLRGRGRVLVSFGGKWSGQEAHAAAVVVVWVGVAVVCSVLSVCFGGSAVATGSLPFSLLPLAPATGAFHQCESSKAAAMWVGACSAAADGVSPLPMGSSTAAPRDSYQPLHDGPAQAGACLCTAVLEGTQHAGVAAIWQASASCTAK